MTIMFGLRRRLHIGRTVPDGAADPLGAATDPLPTAPTVDDTPQPTST